MQNSSTISTYMPFSPNSCDTQRPPVALTATDWNALWETKQNLHQVDHDATFWNKRAKSFTNKDTPGSYTDCFLELANIAVGESVFDMGCGTGNLSIPLAKTGHEVLAADFSSVMLERLTERAHYEGLNNISTKEISWGDDWDHAGITPQSFDVCLASRSIATYDLRAALLKLSAVAKRAVYITLTCDSSPRIDDRALRAIGLETHPSYDSVYALAILQGEGYFPKVDYIKTKRIDEFTSLDEALAKYTDMIDASFEQYGSTLPRQEAIKRMHAWLQENLTEADTKNATGILTLKNPRMTTWAFLSWEV